SDYNWADYVRRYYAPPNSGKGLPNVHIYSKNPDDIARTLGCVNQDLVDPWRNQIILGETGNPVKFWIPPNRCGHPDDEKKAKDPDDKGTEDENLYANIYNHQGI